MSLVSRCNKRKLFPAQPYALTEVAVTGVIIVKQMYYSDTRQPPLMVRVTPAELEPTTARKIAKRLNGG